VTLTEEQHRWLRNRAIREGISMAESIRNILIRVQSTEYEGYTITHRYTLKNLAVEPDMDIPRTAERYEKIATEELMHEFPGASITVVRSAGSRIEGFGPDGAQIDGKAAQDVFRYALDKIGDRFNHWCVYNAKGMETKFNSESDPLSDYAATIGGVKYKLSWAKMSTGEEGWLLEYSVDITVDDEVLSGVEYEMIGGDKENPDWQEITRFIYGDH